VVTLVGTMMSDRRNDIRALRFAERRRREDDAPKLCSEMPTLRNLRLAIAERHGAGEFKHVRPILVDRAPALFLVPCGDPRCVDGGHDLTAAVLRALRAGETSFQGSDGCSGSLGSSVCLRVIHFDCTAEFLGAAPGPAGGTRRVHPRLLENP
jgi:hypothetical protein